MADSHSLPDLPNKPNKTNWVEKAGGLPSYIERIAKHLHSERGMSVSKAIASAINRVKKWAAGSDGTKADTKAKAVAALAQWEAMKASRGVNASQLEATVVFEGVELSVSDRDMIVAMTAESPDELHAMTLDQDIDVEAFELHLAAERAERGLDLAVTFDPLQHPRDFRGRFRGVVGGLKPGDSARLPDGSGVERTTDGTFQVVGEYGDKQVTDDPVEAADMALNESARKHHPWSIGGEMHFRSAAQVENPDLIDEPENTDTAPALVERYDDRRSLKQQAKQWQAKGEQEGRYERAYRENYENFEYLSDLAADLEGEAEQDTGYEHDERKRSGREHKHDDLIGRIHKRMGQLEDREMQGDTPRTSQVIESELKDKLAASGIETQIPVERSKDKTERRSPDTISFFGPRTQGADGELIEDWGNYYITDEVFLVRTSDGAWSAEVMQHWADEQGGEVGQGTIYEEDLSIEGAVGLRSIEEIEREIRRILL